MACRVSRKVASLQVPLASSACALRDRGALSPLHPQHNAIELLCCEPLALLASRTKALGRQSRALFLHRATSIACAQH